MERSSQDIRFEDLDDAEARAMIAEIARASVAACCCHLPTDATSLLRRVDMQGEPLRNVAASLSLPVEIARERLADVRSQATMTMVECLLTSACEGDARTCRCAPRKNPGNRV